MKITELQKRHEEYPTEIAEIVKDAFGYLAFEPMGGKVSKVFVNKAGRITIWLHLPMIEDQHMANVTTELMNDADETISEAYSIKHEISVQYGVPKEDLSITYRVMTSIPASQRPVMST